MIIAGDIYPIDICAHLPIVCEEKGLYYCFVNSRTALGNACGTKRSISALMVKKPVDELCDYKKIYDQVIEGLKNIHPYMQ